MHNRRVTASDVEVMRISEEDLQVIRRAHERLERPSLAIRLTSAVGTPVETGLKRLPGAWKRRVDAATEAAIARALDTAILSLRRRPISFSNERYDRLLGVFSGGLGGFFGLPALLVELPVTTTLMLRAIADIARSEGQELDTPEGRLRCLEVFALGGPSEEDDAAETGYYGVRLALSSYVASVSRHVLEHGLTGRGPAVVRLVSAIASRFGIVVSEKAAAQAVPWLGAAGGAAVNAIFMQHFQDVARGHFALLRLERRYGQDVVRAEYERLSDS